MKKPSLPRIYPTRRGARIVQHGTVLSEVLNRPGPTHSVADAMAAVVHLARPRGHAALLGFAGGGLLAPLRALGGSQSVDAVDLCDLHFRVFEDLCRPWCGKVNFHHAEATAWLKRQTARYDCIIEDLSVAEKGNVVKPEVSWKALPGVIRRRLARNGTMLFNLLRPPHKSWNTLSRLLLGQHHAGLWIIFEEFENRLLVSDPNLPAASRYSRALRQQLLRLESRLAGKIRVRRLDRPSLKETQSL